MKVNFKTTKSNVRRLTDTLLLEQIITMVFTYGNPHLKIFSIAVHHITNDERKCKLVFFFYGRFLSFVDFTIEKAGSGSSSL